MAFPRTLLRSSCRIPLTQRKSSWVSSLHASRFVPLPPQRTGCNRAVFAQARRLYASQTLADDKVEEIQELYATAKDEFEIAAEETEKMTVYAQDDRTAARAELTKLQGAYRTIVEGQDVQLAEEVRRRAGQRIKELEQAVDAMEEMAQHQD